MSPSRPSPLKLLPLPLRMRVYQAGLDAMRVVRSRSWSEPSTLEGIAPGRVTVTGFLGEVLGVGRAGRMTAEHFERAGLSVVRDDLRASFRGILSTAPKPLVGGPGGVWMIHANAPEAELAFLTRQGHTWADRYRIGYWAWETPLAPRGWIKTARWLHEVWTPSRFVADALSAAFDAAGTPESSQKLRVMPHPVEPAGEARRARFGFSADRVEAISMFDGRSAFARKNPWGAIEAWRLAFPAPRGDARLTVKAVRLESDPASAARLRALVAERPDVRLLEEDLSDAEAADLIASVDMVISLHRAEGFGLVLAEAMANRKAVVATGWSGNVDFMDDASAALIPFGLVPIRDPSGAYGGSHWAEPDLSSAAQAIAALVGDAGRRAAIGAAAQARVAELVRPWQAHALRALPMGRFVISQP